MKRIVKELMALAVLSFFMLSACSKTDKPLLTPKLAKYSNTECKSMNERDSEVESIELANNGRELFIKHINGSFSCGFSEIKVEIKAEANLIKVFEREYLGSEPFTLETNCVCLSDVALQVDDMQVGTYIFEYYTTFKDVLLARFKYDFPNDGDVSIAIN